MSEPIQDRGVFLIADTPPTAIPLALEDGEGDQQLLADAIIDHLDGGEVDDLINELVRQRVIESQDGRRIECTECGHVRQTTETYPTLVTCEECGSHSLRYQRATTDRPEAER
jgi:ribosomal protein S27E